jgi:hypothetical protein
MNEESTVFDKANKIPEGEDAMKETRLPESPDIDQLSPPFVDL